MNNISIITDITHTHQTQNKAFKNFMTSDNKFLHLSFLPISDGHLEESYNNFFDQLNSEIGIYDKIENLYLETDFIRSLPTY